MTASRNAEERVMHHVDLDSVILTTGAHDTREDGLCVMELAAWYAGRDHSDAPPCVSPVLRTFGTHLNDALPDGKRQELKPLIPVLVGTSGDDQDEARSYMALDWLIRTWTPAWLDLAGLTDEARALRDLRRIADLVTAQAASPVVQQARNKAAAASDAASDAASAAASDAARDAAWDAAPDAASDAARAAASDAARDAAWAAASDAASDAARAAARAAASDAARDAASDAARDAAWAAAWDAAWAALQPTVDRLQDSAIALYGAMIQPQQVTP